MQPSRSMIKDQILILLNESPKHGYDLLHMLKKLVPNLRLSTLYRWLHDMEKKGLVHSVILPGPYGPNRRVYRISTMGEKQLNELIGNSVQTVLHFYNVFKNTLSETCSNLNISKDNLELNGRILFASVPQITKEDLDTLLFLSMRTMSPPIEILGKSECINDFEFSYKKVKGSIFELTNRKETFSEIWLKWMTELDKFSDAIRICKNALSSNGILYVIVPREPEKENYNLSIRDYIQGSSELESKADKIHQREIGSIIKTQFSSCGFIDLFPGLDVYYCVNNT